jgi:hypothetical protein
MSDRSLFFSELRDDWYRGADLMARSIDRSRSGTLRLVGFPAQWVPVFHYFGAEWSDPIPPPDYVPIISDVSLQSLQHLVQSAEQQGRLRVLVEGVASFDPLVADVLHKLDRRIRFSGKPVTKPIQFTGWQSYGRPEILEFEDRVLADAVRSSSTALALPCARRRPYDRSKTHRRIKRALDGSLQGAVDEIVVSSLGVVPAKHWSDPVVLAYDSGVPDIYRVLRLMRGFFGKVHYDLVFDCLEFEPYRDCLRIVQREGLIGTIADGPSRKIKKLPTP